MFVLIFVANPNHQYSILNVMPWKRQDLRFGIYMSKLCNEQRLGWLVFNFQYYVANVFVIKYYIQKSHMFNKEIIQN